MSAPHLVYRSLVRLYPKAFRNEYEADLVQHFTDLHNDRGARAAWTCTGVDLIVTLPHYRLESIMTDRRSAATLNLAIASLTAAGVVSLLTGVFPGMVLFAAALLLAVSQRSTLARALRTPDSNLRRRRLNIAAVLGASFIVSFVAFNLLIGDTWTTRETVLALIGTPAMIGSFVYLVAGLLTPRDPEPSSTRQAF